MKVFITFSELFVYYSGMPLFPDSSYITFRNFCSVVDILVALNIFSNWA